MKAGILIKTWIGSIFLMAAVGIGVAQPGKEKQATTHWLTDAESNSTRFTKLQRYLRGFDQPMWEVGERFESIYEALRRDNFALASYHWSKIRTTIQNGYLKRPARKANADAILLGSTWETVDRDFQSKDPARAWTGFARARAACLACHVAESVPFMNNQPVFELYAPSRKETQ
ncbi:hypothetical protein [uncultured Microbulbifer sp.]|uniref:hypothetical protein n=1 Tax=uncultured Microbulbifer sp. TaxID=348147 RepID=UPI00261114DA|nr:hypothetical protein [uncultured Microbulbifer sp.]